MIKTVLACLDSSARAELVFSTAAGVANAFSARLRLFRVVAVPPEFPPAAHAQKDELPDWLVKHAEQDLATLSDSRPEVRTERTVVVAPEPWRAILDEAARCDADVIVMGRHDRHGVERILGTTTSHVVDHADRHVLVVNHHHA